MIYRHQPGSFIGPRQKFMAETTGLCCDCGKKTDKVLRRQWPNMVLHNYWLHERCYLPHREPLIIRDSNGEIVPQEEIIGYSGKT